MFRMIILASAMMIGVSATYASENQPIVSKQQCMEQATTLESALADAKSENSVGQKQLDEGEASLKALQEACEKGDLTAAAEAATMLRQSVAAEN